MTFRGFSLTLWAACVSMISLTTGQALAQAGAPDASTAAPATPDQEAAPQPPEIERLLAELAEADEAAAQRMEQRIAQLWSRSGSDSMDYLLMRGREAMNEEAYDKALDHLGALVDLDPDFAEGWNARATAHFLDDELWRSVADIQRVLALEPRHFGALSGLAAILERSGDKAGALAAARAALAIHPNMEQMREAVERLAPEVDGRGI